MSIDEKVAKSFELFEKLCETEAGQLAGGFSDAMDAEILSAGDINISKCHCTTNPTKPTE